MPVSISNLAKEQLFRSLISGSSTLVLEILNELDNRQPEKFEAKILKAAVNEIKDTVQLFQVKKSLRLAALKIKKASFKVSVDGLQKLLEDNNRIEDLSLGIITVTDANAFLAADLFRQSDWKSFPTEILPNFCNFFARHGSLEDSADLEELTRHPDPTVITAALSALEKIGSGNIKSIIEPLLDSPSAEVKAQAVQAYYKTRPSIALKHFSKMLFSKEKKEVALALHHAFYLPYKEVESYLIRLMCETENPEILMPISKILTDNSHINLPFRIMWVSRALKDSHKSLLKGILLGVVRKLAADNVIDTSVKDYLSELKQKVKYEENLIISKTCNILNQEIESKSNQVEDDYSESEKPLPDAMTESENVPPSQSENETAHPTEAETPTKPPKKKAKKQKKLNFADYDTLAQREKIRLLNQLTRDEIDQNIEKLSQLFETLKGKELASLINAFGKNAVLEKAERIKRFFKSSNPDVVCAAIKAMTKLDSDYLCLYLPQFMQEKNGKIRMTATRTFVNIDSARIKSLFKGLLTSRSIKQRTLGISASMLIDFNLVRNSLIESLIKETSLELIEKTTMVLCSNVDREMISDLIKGLRTTKVSLKGDKIESIRIIADKLTEMLDTEETGEEIIQQANEIITNELKEIEIKEKENQPPDMFDLSEQKIQQVKELSKILTSDDSEHKTKRAKLNTIVWVLVAIFWGLAISVGIISLF